eukprot:CAMPEP_0175042512 /NCGR_PEP_ID=MMETSP0052_2-20121109/2613_1 /TAXON_ID=51329 ORGANISM="Polytomella parva, Strain SAG 63-3" /NCGR_SAMPLE_ID=MMETSP0052_2 /ASSEMBLY_ACC=CAM_ASM_000194 /LENGTH=314 /DNA_ID=CAMNT_0016305349 /DNA_START=48 /DNA_END=995 /DNA_ORIENTATION=+
MEALKTELQKVLSDVAYVDGLFKKAVQEEDKDLILSFSNQLTELRKKENLLSQQLTSFVPTSGLNSSQISLSAPPPAPQQLSLARPSVLPVPVPSAYLPSNKDAMSGMTVITATGAVAPRPQISLMVPHSANHMHSHQPLNLSQQATDTQMRLPEPKRLKTELLSSPGSSPVPPVGHVAQNLSLAPSPQSMGVAPGMPQSPDPNVTMVSVANQRMIQGGPLSPDVSLSNPSSALSNGGGDMKPRLTRLDNTRGTGKGGSSVAKGCTWCAYYCNGEVPLAGHKCPYKSQIDPTTNLPYEAPNKAFLTQRKHRKPL